jgi:PAS domain S-box-containing protein
MGMRDPMMQTSKRRPSLVPFAAGFMAVGMAVSGGLATRHVVQQQESRLLKRTSVEVGSTLSSAFVGEEASLRVLNGIDGPPSTGALQDFARRPGPLGGPTLAIFTVSTTAAGFALGADRIGSAPVSEVTPQRAAVANRAINSQKMATTVLHEAKASRLVVAVPGPPGQAWATLHESQIEPTTPYAFVPGSPFSELRGSLYVSSTAAPAALLLTTERTPALSRGVLRTVLPVGADSFVFFTKARTAMVGEFAENFAWIVFAAGLLAALLVTTTINVLSRRRYYALRMVEERTSELTTSVADLTATRGELQNILTTGPTLVVKRTLSPPEVTYISPNAQRLFGHPGDAAPDANFFRKNGHPDDLAVFAQALDDISTARKDTASMELRIRDGAGRYRWISLQMVPDTRVDGRVATILMFILDVDDRHRAHEAQREAHALALAANAAKDTFLSRVSHELRTPLNAILGFGQLLEADATTEDQRDSVAQILDGGRHLLSLVNEVLDVTSLESGLLRLTPETVDSAAIVRECVELMGPAADSAYVGLALDEPAEPVRQHVRADAQRLKQVMLNLLSNAVKYNRAGGSVHVAITAAGADSIAIAVHDTGRGIPASRLGQLFVPFERLGAEQTDIEGIGLGLALARQLARAMEGDITVMSTTGAGSTFTLTLPAAASETADSADELSPRAPRTEASRRVVHIEDYLVNLRLVEHTLAKRGHFTVLPAMTGSLGLDLARLHQPELVIVDLDLPDMTGEAVLHELRCGPSTSTIPVVFLSAKAISAEREAGLITAGAHACLRTPITVSELSLVLERALATRPLEEVLI